MLGKQRLTKLGQEHCSNCKHENKSVWDPCVKCCSSWLNFETRGNGRPLYFEDKEECYGV